MKWPLFILRAFAATLPLLVYSDTIILSDGKILHGELAGTVGGYLSIVVEDSSNQAELRYRIELVERIDFSDSISRQDSIDGFSNRHPRQSIALLEELALKRLPYLEILGPEDAFVFTLLLESYILSGREEDALERAKLWLQKLPSEEAKLRIRELQMIAAWKLDRASDSAYYGRQWINAGYSCQNTALPWVSLANIALKEEDYETALWLALNPIVFSPPSKPSYLEDAYAIAIISAFKVGDGTQAHQLKTEMHAQRLTLPQNSRWSVLIAEAESQSQDGSVTAQSANQTYWNTDTVYKLTGKP